MLNLDAIPEHLKLSRGEYSSVRAAHEDAKKQLSRMCGELISLISKINNTQPKADESPAELQSVFDDAQLLFSKVRKQSDSCESLANQRANLKLKAWGSTQIFE